MKEQDVRALILLKLKSQVDELAERRAYDLGRIEKALEGAAGPSRDYWLGLWAETERNHYEAARPFREQMARLGDVPVAVPKIGVGQ